MLQANALTTLEAVRDASPLAASVSDGRLSLVISAVSDAIESHLRRQFGYFSGKETMAGTRGLELYLPRRPILSVSEVLIDAEAVTDYEIMAGEADGYLYREQGWPLKQSRFPDLTGQADPARAWRSISVTYIAGYILPQWSGVVSTKYNPGGIPANLPALLQEAANQAVLSNLSRVSSRPDPALIQEKTPGGHEQRWQAGVSIGGGTGGIVLSSGILDSIEQYRGKWF